ncbi:MAG: LacI family DNA-binding transcriptional regulator [Chthoniobacteraceae bacterium]
MNIVYMLNIFISAMPLQAESYTKQDFIYAELLKRITTGICPIDALMPTEQELAAEFRCSRGTVGRAIMRLVQEGLVARKPHEGTRVIRGTAAHTLPSLDLDACAFVYPSDQHEGVWRTARGFQQAAHGVKRRTMMLSAGTDFRKEAEIVGRLGEFNVKGAVLFPVITNPTEMAFYSQMILACPFPVVLAELTIPGMGRSSVAVDGLHAGYTMTRHLIDQGLRRIGFLAHYAWAPFIRDRYMGYRQALEEAGIAENQDWVLLESRMNPDFEDPLAEPTRIAQSYLDRNSKMEGVVCASDFMALGLLQAAQNRGLNVPGDLKITGVDDYEIAATASVPLTTYRVSYETLGGKAFDLLNAQMSAGSHSSTESLVRGAIVIRESA